MKMKNKRLASLLAFLPTLIAKAGVELALAITVLLLGAAIFIILYKVIQASHINDPTPGNPTNQVETVTYFVQKEPDEYPGPYPPQTNYYPTVSSMDLSQTNFSFSIQYGIASTNASVPWLVAGSNLINTNPPSTNSDFFYTLENDDSVYDFIFSSYGALSRSTYLDSSDSETLETLSVVVERSPDLVNWQPIFTNSPCILDAVDTFTDTNAPSDKEFYRVYYY